MIEIIASSLEDAIMIEACGADRIELVSRMDLEGLSPDIDLIEEIIKTVRIPINVMVRFISHTFEYQRVDIKDMLSYIKKLDTLNINGIVVGATTLGQVNTDLLHEIKSITDKPITFHRAIDTLDDIALAYKSVYPMVNQVLTSGGPGKAINNLSTLLVLYKLSNETLLIGSGVTLDNIISLKQIFPKANFHIGSDVRVKNQFDLPINQNRLKKLVKTYKEHLI